MTEDITKISKLTDMQLNITKAIGDLYILKTIELMHSEKNRENYDVLERILQQAAAEVSNKLKAL